MKKREFIMGLIIIMTATFAIGCGTKDIAKKNNTSTYNTIKKVAPATEQPTVIISKKNTIPPQVTEEPVVTKAPKKAKESIANSETIKKTAKPKQTKKPVVKKAQPKKTSQPVKKTASPAKKEVKNIKSMTEILTTIALYMSEGENYDPEEEECYYSILYMLGNNVAEQCGRSQYRVIDDQVYVGEKAMQALSAAAFSKHEVIGTVPSEYEEIIQYEKDKKTYVMSGSDAGDVTGKIKKAVANGNGTYTVTFDLNTGDGEVIGTYEFTLVENINKYVKVSPNFYYRVQSVKKLTE